ncbi:MAG: CpsD/CapB family tyrosine-protein kinase [Verrucomicrobiales bacterium]|nr:CpsD/CapB family tyrosine-protein kinase [Verrucomicrobiales bacterium]
MVLNQNAAGYSFTDFKFALRARWTTVVLLGAILLTAGSYLTVKKPISYRAVSNLAFAEDVQAIPVFRSSTDVRPMTIDVKKQARTELMSGVLFLKVADKYDLPERWQMRNRAATLERMRRQIEIVYDPKADLVQVIAHDDTDEGAAMLANAIAMEFVDQKKFEARLKAEERIRNLNFELESRREEVVSVEGEIASLRALENPPVEQIENLRRGLVQDAHLIRSLEAKHQLAVIEQREAAPAVSLLTKAVPEETALVSQRWYLPTMLGLLGVALGVIFIGLFAVRGTQLQIAANLKNTLDLHLIGFAPVVSYPLVRLKRIADKIVEPYRYLRESIRKLPAADSSFIQAISANSDSQLADVISNLCVVMAEAGSSVMLIDGNLRDPQLYKLFDAANHPGLSDYLTGEMRLEETVVKSRKNNLWFMPSGPPREDPSSLFSGKRMEDLVYDMKSRFDYLIMTCPSPLSFSETGIVAGIADHTIAVSSYQKHSEKTLSQIKQSLESSGGLLSGVILSQSIAVPIKKKPAQNRREKALA